MDHVTRRYNAEYTGFIPDVELFHIMDEKWSADVNPVRLKYPYLLRKEAMDLVNSAIEVPGVTVSDGFAGRLILSPSSRMFKADVWQFATCDISCEFQFYTLSSHRRTPAHTTLPRISLTAHSPESLLPLCRRALLTHVEDVDKSIRTT